MKKTNLMLLMVLGIVLKISTGQAQNSNPIFHAIWKEDMAKLKKLVKSGMDINGYYDRTEKKGYLECAGWTPYIAACVKGNMEAVKYLEQKGADIKKTAPDKVKGKDTYNQGQNALYTVANYGDTKMIKYLLNKGFDIESKSSIGFTALISACQHNSRENFKAVKLLVERGANVQAKNNRALFDAALRGYHKIINYLLDKGANVNAVIHSSTRTYKNSKTTPIYYAIAYQRTRTVKLLISRGAKVNKAPGARIAPLHLAAYRKALYCAALLIKNGANPKEKNYKGQTPAQVALEKKAPRTAAFLNGTKPLTPAEKNILKYKQGDIKGFEKMSFSPPDDQRHYLKDRTFTDIKGKKFTMKDFRGKIVFINIWATWCGPCLAEMPEMIELQNKLKGKPFVILTFAVDDSKADIVAFQKKKKYPFIIVHDRDKSIWNKVLGGSLPSTHIFGANGKSMVYVAGALRWSKPQYVQFFKGLMR